MSFVIAPRKAWCFFDLDLVFYLPGLFIHIVRKREVFGKGHAKPCVSWSKRVRERIGLKGKG